MRVYVKHIWKIKMRKCEYMSNIYGKILFFGTDIWIIIHSSFLIITMPFVAIVSLKDRLKAKNKGVVRLPFPFTAGIISGGATISLILVMQNLVPQ